MNSPFWWGYSLRAFPHRGRPQPSIWLQPNPLVSDTGGPSPLLAVGFSGLLTTNFVQAINVNLGFSLGVDTTLVASMPTSVVVDRPAILKDSAVTFMTGLRSTMYEKKHACPNSFVSIISAGSNSAQTSSFTGAVGSAR